MFTRIGQHFKLKTPPPTLVVKDSDLGQQMHIQVQLNGTGHISEMAILRDSASPALGSTIATIEQEQSDNDTTPMTASDSISEQTSTSIDIVDANVQSIVQTLIQTAVQTASQAATTKLLPSEAPVEETPE